MIGGLAALAPKVKLNPNAENLPGSNVLQSLTNGLAAWGLWACVAVVVIGAVTWALAAHADNYQRTARGKQAVIVAGLAALLIGGGDAIINFFYGAGEKI